MRGRPETRPVPPSPTSPAATPARLCGTPRGPQYLGQRVGPRDLCFDCDFPFGGDGVGNVEGGGASPSTGLPVKPVCMGVAEAWICPHQEAASGQEGGQQKLQGCLDQAQDRLCG